MDGEMDGQIFLLQIFQSLVSEKSAEKHKVSVFV